MKETLTLDNIEDLFKSGFNSFFNDKGQLKIDSAVRFMINFFENYFIKSVDSSTKDKDYLFLDYGFYTWREGLPKHFVVNISRHFNPIDFNSAYYYDLCLTLHYFDLGFKEIDTFRINSNKCDDFNDWEKRINESVGYKKILSLSPSSYDTVLIKHKYGW
jgi:hypothetical protein